MMQNSSEKSGVAKGRETSLNTKVGFIPES